MRTRLDYMFLHNMPFLFPEKIACYTLLLVCVQYPPCSLPAGFIRPEILGKEYRRTGTLLRILLLLIPLMLRYVQL
jgi:hypothetical protein